MFNKVNIPALNISGSLSLASPYESLFTYALKKMVFRLLSNDPSKSADCYLLIGGAIVPSARRFVSSDDIRLTDSNDAVFVLVKDGVVTHVVALPKSKVDDLLEGKEVETKLINCDTEDYVYDIIPEGVLIEVGLGKKENEVLVSA